MWKGARRASFEIHCLLRAHLISAGVIFILLLRVLHMPAGLEVRFMAAASSCWTVTLATRGPSRIRVASSLPRISRRSVLAGGAVTVAGFAMGDSASAKPRRKSEAEGVLKNVKWPDEFPFKPDDFKRFDESPDTLFYSSPRFVTHIDDPAIAALTKYYTTVFPPSNTPGVALLDMCSSWVSHYPKNYKQERIAGQGLNEEELKRNPVLTEYLVQDLNVNPVLPYNDNSFDVITNTVSVDYLAKPIEIFKEMNRVLKPGGLACMSFSNRCFPTKAISIWSQTGDVDHVWIVGAYFHYAGGYEPPEALDISPNPGRTDPMYVVYSKKLKA